MEEVVYQQMVKKLEGYKTLTGATPVLISYANAKIEELDSRRQDLASEIAKLIAEAVFPEQVDTISNYLDDWENVSFEDKQQVADVLTWKEFRSYWTGTETYEALKIYMDMNFDGLKEAVAMMLGNGRCRINTRIRIPEARFVISCTYMIIHRSRSEVRLGLCARRDQSGGLLRRRAQ